MKTKSEIQAEARKLEVLGRQYQNEQSQVVSDAVIAMPRVLMALPEAQLAARPAPVSESEATLAPRPVRHIEAAFEGDELVFRLMERETDNRGVIGNDAPSMVASSSSAYDVLRTGYELVEEERLAAELERFAERSEDRDNPGDGEAVAEVEAILETNMLSHADRQRTNAEIVEFLSGRMEPSAFIANAVERQCERESHVERRTQRHELRLTINEP